MTDFLPDLMAWCEREGLDFDSLAATAKANPATERKAVAA